MPIATTDSFGANLLKYFDKTDNNEKPKEGEVAPLFGAPDPVSLPAAPASTFPVFPPITQGVNTQEGLKGVEEPKDEKDKKGGKSKKKKGGKSNKKKFSKKRKGGKRAKSQKKRS